MVIDDLAAKINVLEGLLGYAFPREHFEDAVLWKALNLKNSSQWSRKKKGFPIRPFDLSRLFVHFRLPRPLDHTVFLLPFDEFQVALKEAGVGIHGLDNGHRVRQEWLNDPQCQHKGITCTRVGRVRAGLGVDQENPRRTADLLKIGDRAMLQIKVPATGHLLVFNDQLPAGETTCLMPSCFAVTTATRAGVFRLPSAGSALDVLGPPGWYRVFAIWTRAAIPLAWIDDKTANEPPVRLAPEQLAEVQRALRAGPRSSADYAILTTTYQVVD